MALLPRCFQHLPRLENLSENEYKFKKNMVNQHNNHINIQTNQIGQVSVSMAPEKTINNFNFFNLLLGMSQQYVTTSGT